MSRIPPSNIGPKHLGGRMGPKGPASTKTLTTNTFTTTTGVSSAIHDPSVPRTYLFDIYKNEAESHFEIGEYRLAADCYNAAIKLQPTDISAIVARSRCYTQMGRWKRAMKDCDEALGIDPSHPEALYQKAEILYINGNYDLAHVYFKRGLRQQPDSMLLKHAVQKASDAIHKHGPSAVPTKPTKLTAVGDLTMFLHSKQKRNLQREPTRFMVDDEDGNKLDLPSAGFRARFNVGPLVRINRKPGVSILRAYRPESARSDTSAASASRMPDEGTMRCILGELYGDRKYLKMFQNNLPGGKAERDLTLLADEGLEFLRERTMFWDSLGPLPPPPMPRRSNMKERSFFFGSKESLDTITDARPPRVLPILETTTKGGVSDSEDAQGKATETNGKKRPIRRVKKRQKLEVAMGLERDCTSINFKFSSLKESRSASRMDTASPDGTPMLTALKDTGRSKTRIGRGQFAGIDAKALDRKRELTRYINKEMDNIDEAFKDGEFAMCKAKAEECLDTISQLDGEDINKSEVMASLYSCVGNASIAMNDFDSALNNHLQALHIGETENIKEVINRSLGHLGRMYIIQKRFNKALEVFARKAPTVVSAEEVAQVFHEIGNCFLALGHLDYARDCGKKALRAAEDADIHYFKFQSWVLIAVSESRMKHHEEAYKAFQCALELAKKKDDQESMTVILFALEHLSKTITSILKKRELLSERLSSRSKTQTLIDLNKRPPAARQRRRKKKLRREATTLDGDDGADDSMTRQNTMLETERTFHLTTENTMLSPRSPQPLLPPLGQAQTQPEHSTGETSVQHRGRSGSVMFEENPRELEPFHDPRLKSRQGSILKSRTSDHYNTPSPHKRHGILASIDGRSGDKDGAGRHDNEAVVTAVSRERTLSNMTPGKMTPVTPRVHMKGDSPASHARSEQARNNLNRSVEREGEGGAVSKLELANLGTPRETTERRDENTRTPRHAGGQSSRQLSPGKAPQGNLEGSPVHDVSAVFSDTSRPEVREPSNVSEREYVLMTDRTGVTSQSDLDVEGMDTFRGAEALANRHRNMPQFLTATNGEPTPRSVDLRDTSIEEKDMTLDITQDLSSGGPGHFMSDMTSGHFADISCNVDESMELPRHSLDLQEGADPNTPRDSAGAEKSPRRKRTHRTTPGILNQSGGYGEKTPGRFTRESFFEEDEEGLPADTTVNPADETFDLVSVSRQRIVHPQDRRKSRDVDSRAHDKRITNTITAEAPPEEDEMKLHANQEIQEETSEREISPKQPPLERQSSRVSLKGRGSETAEVTLETTKPYRVSSARKQKDGDEQAAEDTVSNRDQTNHVDVGGVAETVKDPQNRAEATLSPVKSPKSHITTGSGWDGDVSLESALGAGDQAYVDNAADQRPTLTRQKTKLKHKKPSSKDDIVDDDDDDKHESKPTPPKPTPKKRPVKKTLNEDPASAADDEDDDDQEPRIPVGDSTNETSLVPAEVQREVLAGSAEIGEADAELQREMLRLQAARDQRVLSDIASVPASHQDNDPPVVGEANADNVISTPDVVNKTETDEKVINTPPQPSERGDE